MGVVRNEILYRFTTNGIIYIPDLLDLISMTNPILTDDKIDVNPQTLLIRYDGDTKQLKKQILTALAEYPKLKEKTQLHAEIIKGMLEEYEEMLKKFIQVLGSVENDYNREQVVEYQEQYREKIPYRLSEKTESVILETEKLKAENEELKQIKIRLQGNGEQIIQDIMDEMNEKIKNLKKYDRDADKIIHYFEMCGLGSNFLNFVRDTLNRELFGVGKNTVMGGNHDYTNIKKLQQENNELKEEKEQFLALIVKIQSENEELKQLKQRVEEAITSLNDGYSDCCFELYDIESDDYGKIRTTYSQKLQQLLKDDTK